MPFTNEGRAVLERISATEVKTMAILMQTYNGYKLTVRDNVVSVFDPRFKKNAPLYQAKSLEAAKKWVDDYRDARQSAILALDRWNNQY